MHIGSDFSQAFEIDLLVGTELQHESVQVEVKLTTNETGLVTFYSQSFISLRGAKITLGRDVTHLNVTASNLYLTNNKAKMVQYSMSASTLIMLSLADRLLHTFP